MRPVLEALCPPAPDGGQRLYLHHRPPPGQPVRGTVVQVHAWAEEMNKSRRMAAQASRALAADGWAVLQIALMGCGDSSGDFADARWATWLDDIDQAADWLTARHPGVPLWLWGQRAGALLAAAAAARRPATPQLPLWQPVTQGKTLMQQFLRLKAAAQLADGGGKAILEAARADLAAGRPVEIAGYWLHPALHDAAQAASLRPPAPQPAGATPRLVWLEVSSAAEPALSPVAQTALAAWRSAGWSADAAVVAGPPFWQTVEIEDAPDLTTATVQQLAADRVAA